jgi:hypothetical protein
MCSADSISVFRLCSHLGQRQKVKKMTASIQTAKSNEWATHIMFLLLPSVLFAFWGSIFWMCWLEYWCIHGLIFKNSFPFYCCLQVFVCVWDPTKRVNWLCNIFVAWLREFTTPHLSFATLVLWSRRQRKIGTVILTPSVTFGSLVFD